MEEPALNYIAARVGIRMRNQLTAISASSALIAFTAGIVLCSQLITIDSPAGMAVAEPVRWAIEATIFGTAVFIWRPQISFLGWLLGIAGLVAIRLALGSAATLLLCALHVTTNTAPVLAQASAFLPRLCATGFALMVCYPFRVFLPLRDQTIRWRRFRNGRAGSVNQTDPDLELLIVTAKERAANIASVPSRGESKPQTATGIVSSTTFVEGDIEVPMSTVLALMPENLITDRALALSDSQTMTLPLSAILPQLREAQIIFSVADLRERVPLAVRKALVQPADSDIETENGLVAIPLNLVIPQLPPEALELPPPSLPAWAKVATEEHIVFATV